VEELWLWAEKLVLFVDSNSNLEEGLYNPFRHSHSQKMVLVDYYQVHNILPE
jgi:hypothetical protein